MCEWVKPTGRAASMAYAYLNFWEKIKDNTLPSILVLNLVPICAARYRYLMACTRLPGVPMDELKLYEDSKHVIVIRKGVMYRVNVYCTTPSGEERILAAEEIQRQIEIIMEDTAALKETIQNPALFTGQGGTQWAQEREKLQLHKVNAASLKDVESAIFHIVMEDTSPEALFAPAQMSTSQSPYQFDSKIGKRMKLFPSGGAFGPQRHDGYGVYYLFLGDNAMTIYI